MYTIQDLQNKTKTLTHVYKPIIYRLENLSDREAFEQLIASGKVLFVHDEIATQLKDLLKSRNPSQRMEAEEYEKQIEIHLQGQSLETYGVWVYYPWNASLVHLLDEDEFIEVRTNRNKHKVTSEECAALRTKKVGVIGLSVGHSIALTLATERTCGELRLADFDELELSNLNRIRSSVQRLGVPKVVIAAREIAEIDPFLRVIIYPEGLNPSNIDRFFIEGGNLDLLIEVCDSLEMKIKSRFKARELKIPVVMDTNDRGMLDVERFDLDPDRDIFHGLLREFTDSEGGIAITDTNRMKLLMSLVDFNALSDRMKYSMAEIGKSISSWPQLASSVVLGGAITTDIARRILLSEHTSSARYYVDLDQIFGN